MIERRKHKNPGKGGELPVDYLKMISEVFTNNFDEALKVLSKNKKTKFESFGYVYPDEILLAVSLCQDNGLSTNTFYASIDFDPQASSPDIQELLSVCVDAIGSIVEPLLDLTKNKTQLEALLDPSLSALENVPFEWTELEINKRKVFVKMDKTNLSLEAMAENWLSQNDPENKKLKQAEETDQSETLSERVKGLKKSGRFEH